MNDALQRSAREAHELVSQGSLRGDALLRRILEVPLVDRDAWVDVLLGIDQVPDDAPGLPRDSVPYLPAGVEEILVMVRELPLRDSDELVDLGSGVGRVVMLVSLLTGARARGLELQPHLVAEARARGASLGLAATFEAADVTQTGLDGSVFFLYAPFGGQMLERALSRLKEVAERRHITLCAVDLQLEHVPWLRSRETSSLALTFYESLV